MDYGSRIGRVEKVLARLIYDKSMAQDFVGLPEELETFCVAIDREERERAEMKRQRKKSKVTELRKLRSDNF